MASFTKLPSGSWRAQIRRKGRYVSETFLRRDDARRWAVEVERQIDRGEAPSASRVARLKTFGELIDLHINDMCAVGKAPRRSKAAVLEMLRQRLGRCNMTSLDRERLIAFGRDRAAQGAGPVTLGIDVGMIKLVLSHAAAVHGVPITIEPVDLARIALKRLGLVGKGDERDRRPTQDELDRLIAFFDKNPRQIAPMGRIVRFAVATAMRQEEICTVRWSDIETRTRMLLIRDRKDPRKKQGNNQRIPLFAACGYDAWGVIEEQNSFRKTKMTEYFHLTANLLALLFSVLVKILILKIFISMICAMKRQVDCLRQVFQSSKWHWLLDIRIGRCLGDTHT